MMKQSFGHFRPARPSFPAELSGWVCFLLLFLVGSVRAADLPDPVILDIPLAANQVLPSWLGAPEMPQASFATLNLPILTPDTDASLLVTVYFQEKQDGFMRIIWKGTQDAQILSDNFYENIGMANQRSLLISPATLVGDGILIFQCGDSNLGIKRIKFEWLQNRNGLVSPTVRDLLVTPSTGPTQLSLTLNGQANPTEPGAWENQLISVPLTDQALRVEQGIEFDVDLDLAPGSARLTFDEAGLSLGKHLVVWVNQQRAGTITPVVPDLQDGGFLPDENAKTGYQGWRNGSFYVPVALLKAGINAVQFSREDDAAAPGSAVAPDTGASPPMAIKNLVLQLNYQTPPAGTNAAQSPSTPTGPVPPTESSSTPPETTTP
ncbi:MAG: hypothetical protein LV480_11200 [Methylacidiphilales bacterium]|nr:hypothetical protein [Candidatus Methylacidiphilales bacterium]